jgi:drug/metabolite transporter (DMT)-like permease
MKKEKNILQTHPTQSGFLIALVSAVFLSFTGILIKIISTNHHLPALILAFWRDLFVTLCLFPVLSLIKPKLLRPGQKDLPYLMLYGAILALFNILWTLSVTLTGAAVATVLVYASGGFTALLGWLLLKESLGWQKVLAVVLSLSGCLLVSGAIHRAQWKTNLPGIFTGLLSGLLYAIYSLMGRHAAQKQLNAWTTLFYTFGFATLLLLAVNLLPIEIFQATANGG